MFPNEPFCPVATQNLNKTSFVLVHWNLNFRHKRKGGPGLNVIRQRWGNLGKNDWQIHFNWVLFMFDFSFAICSKSPVSTF